MIIFAALSFLCWWKWEEWHIPCILTRLCCFWRNNEPRIGLEDGTCKIRLNNARRLASDAEKFKEEDDKEKDPIAAENGSESYCFRLKSCGKQEKITITNDKSRLSKEEIEQSAAKYGLESYCFKMKSTIEDEKLKDKITEGDRKIIMDKCNEIIAWLDANQNAEEDEYKDKQKEVEDICNPIITKLYQSADGTKKVLAVTPIISRFYLEKE